MANENFYETDETPGSFNFYEGHEQAILDITAERLRQIAFEGWTPEHDDAHGTGELADAAACYALGTERIQHFKLWPWSWEWWKPTDRRCDLVKAGALIVAEIERLDRAELSKTKAA
jgi:hypothetical protein